MAVTDTTSAWVHELFTASIVPTLVDYIKIPNKSPMFEPGWVAAGHMERAVALFAGWATQHLPAGATLEIVRLTDGDKPRTPVIFIDIPGTGGKAGDTVMLYGRGGADDGYAIFASLTAINALRKDGTPHARCVVLIEACEESGSVDLPAYVDALAGRLGTPGLVVCLDSGCGNYEQLWGTTSLRGLVGGELAVEVLAEGVHSGASGIVPSSFRILRAVLARLEDAATGAILPRELHAEIPPERLAQARAVAAALGAEVWNRFPFVPGMRAVHEDPVELLLASTWRPALAVTGADGLPALADAGNVLRPRTAVKLSLRLPPTVDPAPAAARIKELLEAEPPYGARVTFTPSSLSAGWEAPPMREWLAASVEAASRAHFGKPAMFQGTGGSIPFMAMLGERFPDAQFLITGVFGPESNAHGPNEFLHVPTGVRVTACVAHVLADHFRATSA